MLNRIRLPYFAVLMVLSLGIAQNAIASRLGDLPVDMPPAPAPTAPDTHGPEGDPVPGPSPSPSSRIHEVNALVFPENFDKLHELLNKGETKIGKTAELEYFARVESGVLSPSDVKPEDFVLKAEDVKEIDKRVTTLREYIKQLKECGTQFPKMLAMMIEKNLINPMVDALGTGAVNEGELMYTMKTVESLLSTYAKVHPETDLALQHAKVVSAMKDIIVKIFGQARETEMNQWVAKNTASGAGDGMAIMKAKMEKAIAESKESNEVACPIPNVPAGPDRNRAAGPADDSDKSDDKSPGKKKLITSPFPPSTTPITPTEPKKEKTMKDKALEKLQEFYGMVKNVMSQQESEQAARDAKLAEEKRDTMKKLEDMKKDKGRDADEKKAEEDAAKKKKQEEQLRQLEQAKKKEDAAEKPHAANRPEAPAAGGDEDSAPRKLTPAPAPQNQAQNQGQPGQGQGQGQGAPPAGGATPSDAEAPSSDDGSNRFSMGGDGANIGLVQPLSPAPVSASTPVGGNAAVADLMKTVNEARSSGVGNQAANGGRPNAQSLAGRAATGGAGGATSAPYNAPGGYGNAPLSNPSTFGGVNGLAVKPPGARTDSVPSSLNMSRGLNRPLSR